MIKHVGILAFATLMVPQTLLHAVTVEDLRCEYRENPLGIDVVKPRLSWKSETRDQNAGRALANSAKPGAALTGMAAGNPEVRGQKQSAYQVLVASSLELLAKDQGDLWDSGKVVSAQSIQVEYAGKPLQSRMACCWRVRVWDKDGKAAWSKPATFEMGLLEPDAWQAKWIGMNGPEGKRGSPLLRKEVAITGKVKRARVYVSGLGWSELYINGKKVSDDVLSPGLTDYSQEIQYCTYDVTDLLKQGVNALGMMLGNGWFSATTFFNNQPWADRPQAILQMTVTYEDGTEKQFFTDETWKAAGGAIVSNLKNSGEVYDARLEKPQWNMVGYDDSQWSQASVMSPSKGRLTCRAIPPMKVQNTLRPVRVTADGKDGWMFEFDRYFSGWVRLNVKGKSGTTITLNHEDNEKDVYILKGAPEGEVYEPRFALHGVRHVLVTGLEGEPTLDTLAGREVYSDVDLYGSFTCSNELFNKIHGNIQRSLKVALKGFVLDCLHREPVSYNEPASIFGALSTRKGMPDFWTGYARMIQLGASADGDLSDVVPVFPGKRRDSDVSQNASYPMLIWNLYENFGDHRLLEQHYPTVKAWVDFIGRQLAEPSHIVRKGWLGEHMLPKRGTPGWEFISKETPKDLIWTCFYYQNARVLSSMSRVLGMKEDEKRYADLAEEIRTVINKTWLDETTGHYATKSQTSEILPLAIGIVPPDHKQKLIDNIAQTITGADGGKFRVGHVGLPGYMESLVENGLGEIVYKTVNTTEFPGWGYMISEGATTVWESWSMVNGGYNRAESMTMLAGVCRFFYDSIAGIQEPNFYGTREFEPGYGVIRIKPHVLGDLTHASASIKTIRGIVSSDWKKTGDSLVLNVIIPANASGRVSVPSLGLKNATLTEGGKTVWKDGAYVKGVAGITAGKQEPGYYTFDVGSGEYGFKVE